MNAGYSSKPVSVWLLGTAALVLFTVCVGGYTRLSRSGLSMTRWKPIGYRYPSSAEQWEAEFADYRRFPEFAANPDLSLAAFKRIFFVEYFHRLVGNVIGFAFGLPLLYFLSRGYFTKQMKRRCLTLFAIGGVQGLIGWWMVKSGLQAKPDYQSRPRVSTYRLLVHNGFAVCIYSYLLYLGLTSLFAGRKSLKFDLSPEAVKALRRSKLFALLLLHFLALNVVSGVSVAGIDAGKVFNTWPDMNGALVPGGYWKPELGYRNLFENMATVQFNHRIFAYLTYTVTTVGFLRLRKLPLPLPARLGLNGLLIAVNWQAIYGIHMLLNAVPTGAGVIHQFSAMTVLTLAVYLFAYSKVYSKKVMPIKL